MARRGQGVRSSRTSPVSHKERRRLRTLDRQIGQLDRQLQSAFWPGYFNRATIEKRQRLDAERKALRIAIKRPVVLETQ